jgi:1-phosphofructokinase
VLLIELERDAEGEVEVHVHPGGQGYWVGRMASALGVHPVLCAPVGGEVGTVVSDLLGRDKVALRSVPMKGDNATFIHDRRDGERRVVLETRTPVLGRHVLDQLFSITLAAGLEAGVCVVAGSQSHTVVQADTYERLIADLVETGVIVVTDLAGEVLQPALAGAPHVLKVSHEEMIEDGYARDESIAELTRGIEELQQAGARDVVVSRAADPVLASIDGELVEAVAPELRVVDDRGAGDSMTAGLAVSIVRGMPRREGLALAVAAGALNVTRHGLASGHASTIEQLARRVEVRSV